MTANTDKLLSILTGILITVLVYFSGLLVPPGSRQVYFGAYVWHCHLLHIEPVIQYRILHPANAALHIRLTCLIGGIFFWPHISSSKH